MTDQPDLQCPECRGRGYAERIGGWERPCDACKGTGEQMLHLSDFTSAMTEPDLPPELLERVRKTLWEHVKFTEAGFLFPDDEAFARAVAPLLTERGRELEKAEVVAWLEQRERDSMNGHVVAGCRIGIKNGEHKQESQ